MDHRRFRTPDGRPPRRRLHLCSGRNRRSGGLPRRTRRRLALRRNALSLTIQRSEDSAWLGVRNPNDFGDVMWLANADLVIDPAQRAVFTLPVGALIVLSLTALRDFSAGGQAFPPTQEEFRAHGNVNGGSLWCDGPTVGAGEAPFGILSTAPGAFTIRYDISAQTDDQLRRHQGAFALARRLRLRCGRCEKRTMHPGRDRREPRALHGGTPLECGRAIRDPTPAFRALE